MMPNDMMLNLSVRVYFLKTWLRQRLSAFLSGAAAALPVAAFADGDIADMANRAAEGAKSGIKSSLTIAQFAGVFFVIGGLIAAKNKKDNPQVKTWHILASILFGVCLIVVPEIIKRAQTQVGLTPVNVG
ncbi:conjugal transfer protein TraR [Serratia ureilytica]|nr:conjugal transfer protein TraR [Serratia ureilytica]